MNREIYIPLPEESFNHFFRRIIEERPDKKAYNMLGVMLELAVTELKDQPHQMSADLSEHELVFKIIHKGKPLRKDIVMLINDFLESVSYHETSSDEHTLTIKKSV